MENGLHSALVLLTGMGFFVRFFTLPTLPSRVYFRDYREKSDPFAVENLDSNNVLEIEIASVSSKAATGDLPAVMRKGALETKLLVSPSCFVVSPRVLRLIAQ